MSKKMRFPWSSTDRNSDAFQIRKLRSPTARILRRGKLWAPAVAAPTSWQQKLRDFGDYHPT